MALHDFSFADVYRRNAALFPQRPAFTGDARTITHAQYWERVQSLAAGFAARGVKPGDRIGIVAQNSIAMIEVYGAAAVLNAIVLPVNYRLTPDEIAYVLADGAPAAVVAAPDYQPMVEGLAALLPSVKSFVAIGPASRRFEALDALRLDAALPPGDVDADAGFVIIPTAAVGGKPRGALLSQTNLLCAQSALVQAWALTERDVNYGALPLFHIAGLGLLLTVQQAGGASVIVSKFDAAQMAGEIAAEGVTVASLFAPMLGQLLDAARPEQLGSLRAVTGLDSPDTIARFEAACPDARFWATFGQSETSGLATLSPFRDRPKSAGRPLFWRTMAVVDRDDRPLPAGEAGEIVVRGPTVFKGYWNDEAGTAYTFRNGWHHTGDIGRFDEDGYLWYVGRAPDKELIKTGGENVYPAEVEAALRRHPAIAEAVVIGVPDPQWGEAVKAVCQCHPGQIATPEAVIAFVGDAIARYKRPKHVVFVEILPRTSGGEIDRAAVRAAHGA